MTAELKALQKIVVSERQIWTGAVSGTMVNGMRTFLIVCCVAGIAVPYWFALPFFLTHGANFSLFFEEVFQTDISRFFAADLIMASLIFLAWSLRDSRKRKIAGWWVVLLSNLVVGLSLALPLYLLKRLESKQG